MRRLGGLVVVGALAVAVSVVAAGPAFAAKGGNNDTAKACQKGAWQTLRSQTGARFNNQGDCVNDGAHGLGVRPGPTPGPIPNPFVVSMDSYNCPNDPNDDDDCYGTVSGSGLSPGSGVRVILTFFGGQQQVQTYNADGAGDLAPVNLNLTCDETDQDNNVSDVEVDGTTASQQGAETDVGGPPC